MKRAGTVVLTGKLICADEQEAETVRRHLPRHVELTLAEEGCQHFDVSVTADPLIWTVSERFADQAAFDAHQARVRASEWGQATASIVREYVVTTDDR